MRSWGRATILAAGLLLVAAPARGAEPTRGPEDEAADPAASTEALSPAEAAEVRAETEALAAEREAEVQAGLLPSEAEVAGRALSGVSRLGARSPLRLRVDGALGGRLGPDLFCPSCAAHERPKGARPSGLDGIDPAVAQRDFDIPIVINDEVRAVVDYFTNGPGRPHFARWLARARRFVPLITPILESHGLPRDLVYVAMIESGFSTHAYSAAAAVGPWQFISSTARLYRLRMDAWVDERRDPVRATHAAAKFLRWLHDEFDDWYLAFAGYNGGPGRVRRTIDATGVDDYWGLCRRDALPRETCGYVPKIIAAALIARYPTRFGFDSIDDSLPPFEYDEVEVPGPLDLREVARAAGTTFENLKVLNPELRRWVTPPPPPGTGPYVLRLPPGTRDAFEAHKDALHPAARGVFARHRIEAGDTLWKLASRYGCSVQDLVSLNGITDPRGLRLGMELVVPLPGGAAAPRPAAARTRAGGHRRGGHGSASVYTVVAGDTLWAIAQRYGVTTEALCRANGLRHGRHVALSIGQRLQIPAGSAPAAGRRTHTLRPGETLWQLSRRYGCTVEDLRRWNRIGDDRSLEVGQVLVVAP